MPEMNKFFIEVQDGEYSLCIRLDTIYAIQAIDDGCIIMCENGRVFDSSNTVGTILDRMRECLESLS